MAGANGLADLVHLDGEDGLANSGAPNRAAVEVAEVQIGIVEGGAIEDGILEVGTPEAGSREVGLAERGSGEISLGHLAATKIDIVKAKAGEVDSAQVGTGQAVASPQRVLNLLTGQSTRDTGALVVVEAGASSTGPVSHQLLSLLDEKLSQWGLVVRCSTIRSARRGPGVLRSSSA